jgi:hypothetical protein
MKPIDDHKIPDGIYRMEFTSGEKRGSVSYLHAEIIDQPEDGKFAPEFIATFSISWRSSIEERAIKEKTDIYADVLGLVLGGIDIDYEDFLFKPFFAYIRGGYIFAVSADPASVRLIPDVGRAGVPLWDRSKRTLTWLTSGNKQKAA